MTRKIFAVFLFAMTIASASYAAPPTVKAPAPTHDTSKIVSVPVPTTVPAPTEPLPVFRHGDCSWLPKLAVKAGWSTQDIPKLTKIILRESGCCPNRRGGDRVDKDCNILAVSEWNHRSDTGLLQINGVHWKPDHKQYAGAVCKRMKICTQEPLLDPLTNLMAGQLLYNLAGWSPWSVPSD